MSKKHADDAPAWPVGEDGQKVKGEILLYAKNPIELNGTQNLLHAYGIPCLDHAPNQGFLPPYTRGLYLENRLLVTAGASNVLTCVPRVGNPREVALLELSP